MLRSRYLNVSSNILGNIEHIAFQDLVDLRVLDLSSNQLKDLSLKLPTGIEHISLSKNQLKYWPIEKHPTNMEILELQENELMEIYNTVVTGKNRIEFPSLKLLNVSRNRISSIPPTITYPELEIFDASFNAFSKVPQYLGSQAPNLKVLRLRGNPIKNIEFSTKLSAHILDFSELPMLTEFDANVFNSLGLYYFEFIFILKKTHFPSKLISAKPQFQTSKQSPNLDVSN